MRPMSLITVLAGVVLVQTGTSQNPTPVSLAVVTSTDMANACKEFSCIPLQIKGNGADVIEAYVSGPANGIYALFAGLPVDHCVPVPGIANSLTIWLNPVVLGVGPLIGRLPVPPDPISCEKNLVTVRHTTGFPGWMVPGDGIRFQALAYESGNVPTFSRAVDVTCR